MTYAHLIREANLIDGLWVPADGGKTIDVMNPANVALSGRGRPSGGIVPPRSLRATFSNSAA